MTQSLFAQFVDGAKPMLDKNQLRNGSVDKLFGRCDWSIEKDYVHIYNLYVVPCFRRQGKAKILLQTAIDQIRLAGYVGAISIVGTSKLRSFYTRMGLEVYDYYG